MDKKELKFYEAPACEVVELKLQASVLVASGEAQEEDTGAENAGAEGL